MAAETSIGKLLVELLFKDKGVKAGLKTAEQGFETLKTSAMAAAKVLAGVGTAMAAVGTMAVQKGAQFESFETRLATMMGSATGARLRMAELFEYATTTPFDLPGVVEADVTLRAFGANAEKMLPLVIDFAAAMGTDLTLAARDVGKAMTQGAGALESDAGKALRAAIEMRTGVKATELTLREFQEALTDTLSDPEGKFAGGAARLSKTFEGVMSNLRDSWDRFLLKIADAGLFDGVKAAAAEVLDMLNESADVVSEFSGQISEGLVLTLGVVITAAGDLYDAFFEVKVILLTVRMSVMQFGADFMSVIASIDKGLAEAMELAATLALLTGQVAASLALKAAAKQTRVEMAGAAAAAADLGRAIEKSEDNLRNALNEAELDKGAKAAYRITEALLKGAAGAGTFSSAMDEGADNTADAAAEGEKLVVVGEQLTSTFGTYQAQMLGLLDTTEDLTGPSRWERLTQSLQRVGAVAGPVLAGIKTGFSTIFGIVGKLVSLFDQFLQKTSGFSLGDLGDVARGAGSEDGNAEQITTSMIQGAIAGIEAFVERLPDVVDALVVELPDLMDAVAENLEPVLTALLDGVKGVINESFDNVDAITAALKKVIDSLVSYLGENLSDLVVKALAFGTELVVTIIGKIPDLIVVILKALPTILMELHRGIGDVLLAIVGAIPDIIMALITEGPKIGAATFAGIVNMMLRLIVELTKMGPILTGLLVRMIIDAVIVAWNWLGEQFAAIKDEGFLPWLKSLWDKAKPQIVQWLKDLFLPNDNDQAAINKTFASFGDTPGAVSAGTSGMFAKFKPGDFVIAAQSPLDVLRQAKDLVGGGGSGGGGGSTSIALTVMAEGQTLDQVLMTAARRGKAPGITSQIKRRSGVTVGFDRGPFNKRGG